MDKNKTRLLTILLLIMMLISIIPTTAFADNGFNPIDATGAAGGSGVVPGSPKPGGNSGVWSDRFQGFRITVLDYAGTPAFTFNGKDYLDLVFSKDCLSDIDYFGDGVKTGVYRGIYRSSGNLKSDIVKIGDIRAGLDAGSLTTAVPNPANLNKAIAKFSTSSIPKPLSTVGTGADLKWVTYGNEIKKAFYGSGDKLDETALLYVILNIAKVNSNNTIDWLWQPKAGAYLQNNSITNEEMEQLKAGTIRPIELMADKGLVVTIEPIIWNKLRLSSSQYSYGVYGTQTAIGGIIHWLESGGWFKPTVGVGTGGYDTSLFGRMGRRSMVTEGGTLTFKTYRNGNGNIIEDTWIIPPPKDTGQRITNQEVYNIQPGWSLHLYKLRGKLEDTTHTFDKPKGDIPHEAPNIDKSKLKSPDKAKINIIKTYEEDGNHVGTYNRNNNPQNIMIENEVTYKVDEWFISKDFTIVNESTTWTEIKNNTSSSSSGKSPTIVKVEEPNTTLYVKLVKKTPVVNGNDTDLIITESQITKAVDTLNNKIPNWGAKVMNFDYQNLSGTCSYTWSTGSGDNITWHTCGKSYVMRDSSHEFRFKNIEPIKDKLQANVGVFKPLHAPYNGVSHTRDLSAGTYGVDEFNYQMVLWRGQDKPTIAAYKENSNHELNVLLGRYGKQPAGNRIADRAYFDSLSVELDKDGSIGDYYTESGHHDETKSSTATNSNTIKYSGNVTIQSYIGKRHDIGNAITTNTTNIFANLAGKSVSVRSSGGTVVPSSRPVKFYPYHRMTYQKPTQADNDRINVNVLSQWISELYPSSFAEAAWGSTKDLNMNISSAQWSVNKRATSGTDGWQGSNQVLPGGAPYNLDTRNQNTYASVITWQPYIEDEIANKVLIEGGASYKLADTVAPHEDLVKTAEKALESWSVVQWVNPNVKATNAWSAGGIKVGAGVNLVGLDGNKGSTEDKYYLNDDPTGTNESAGEADLDIIKTTTVEIHYKVKADVEGNITVHRNRDSSGWVEIDRLNKTQGIDALSPESQQLNDRTQIITNLITVLTRNEGNDTSASWAPDGKWYNEAFDGINYIRRETCFEVGFLKSGIRGAALDPNLSPKSLNKGDIFTNAYLSQFRLNDKSAAYTSEVSGYVGKFKGQDVILNGAEDMFKTRKFYIPNANVQDLRN